MTMFASLIIAVTAAVLAADDVYAVGPMPVLEHPPPPFAVPGVDHMGHAGLPNGPFHPGDSCPALCPLHWDPRIALCEPGRLAVFVNHCALQREVCLLNRKCVLFKPEWDPHHPEGWH
ncbi:uncharacterized protein LOC126267415 [Schistocerca gregaria]|uniref:uncharacterized protein LOC126267415 n=1 Tax=Schistocerca gregaria TaxID=7010 RepID=UPI00211E4FA7|nr:uncharacterized protein LOC126267415 [Schistocerca gregaria]